MLNLWNEQEAARHTGALAQRVYSSRLLGQDSSLVLHGGGNTSVKTQERNVFGELEDILWVKGSGWDLDTIEAGGFAPCRVAHLLKLATLEDLSDPQMSAELRASMTKASAPAPSVEAILHALLPHAFVDHTHADALIAITNTPSGDRRIRELYGDRVVVIPYVMPGFKLARLCAQLFPDQAGPDTCGMVLMNHGLFTFGATARESYERMIDLVGQAEAYLAENKAWFLPAAPTPESTRSLREDLATLRREASSAAGRPMILASHQDAQSLGFARRADLEALAQRGPATPDHVLRTKRVPLVGRDVAGFRQAYEAYFQAHSATSGSDLTMLDPAPRVILDPELGLCTLGRTAKEAAIVEDIYRHTIDVILRAEALEQWQPLPAQAIFDVEYWDLEQAKLRKAGAPLPFAGEVALVTGAASGIGKACVAALLQRGAAVIGLDLNPAVVGPQDRKDYRGIACDLTQESQVLEALEQAVRTFGGLDMLVLNAGIFPKGAPIAELPQDLWHRVMDVNLDATFRLLQACHPLLKLAPNGGRVVVIGSKNVAAPGPGAAAYSASKAAVNQLARVAALEWGEDGIRVNSIHPNMVFDTALWTDEILASRAKHYGLTVDQYKTQNVLRTGVTSADVAEMAAALCSPLFAKTTGAQIPVDGGNDRVI